LLNCSGEANIALGSGSYSGEWNLLWEIIVKLLYCSGEANVALGSGSYSGEWNLLWEIIVILLWGGKYCSGE